MFKIISITVLLLLSAQLFGQDGHKLTVLYTPNLQSDFKAAKAALIISVTKDSIEIKQERDGETPYTITYSGKNRPSFTTKIYEKSLTEWYSIDRKFSDLKCTSDKNILLMFYERGNSANLWFSDRLDCYPSEIKPFMKGFIDWLKSDW